MKLPQPTIHPDFRRGFLFVVSMMMVILTPTRAGADSPARMTPRVFAATRGNCFFRMLPGQFLLQGEKSIEVRKPSGAVYSVDEDGAFHELWKVSGWYAFQGFLSDDGRYFVRFGLPAHDWEKKRDLAVAFYDRGKLLKQYQVRQLIRAPEALVRTTLSYQWQPEIQTEPNGFRFQMEPNGSWSERFYLVLIDRTVCEFDFTTGKLVKRGTDPGARSARDYYHLKK